MNKFSASAAALAFLLGSASPVLAQTTAPAAPASTGNATEPSAGGTNTDAAAPDATTTSTATPATKAGHKHWHHQHAKGMAAMTSDDGTKQAVSKNHQKGSKSTDFDAEKLNEQELGKTGGTTN